MTVDRATDNPIVLRDLGAHRLGLGLPPPGRPLHVREQERHGAARSLRHRAPRPGVAKVGTKGIEFARFRSCEPLWRGYAKTVAQSLAMLTIVQSRRVAVVVIASDSASVSDRLA